MLPSLRNEGNERCGKEQVFVKNPVAGHFRSDQDSDPGRYYFSRRLVPGIFQLIAL